MNEDLVRQSAQAPFANALQARQKHQEVVRLTVTGSPQGVNRIIHKLHCQGFAEPNDWSPAIPTGKLREVIRVLIRRILVD